MHYPTDSITHTTAFVTPVVEHWLEREIVQWVHPMKDRSEDPSHHERTLLPRSYISLLPTAGLPISQDHSNQVERIYWLIWRLKSIWGTPTLTGDKFKADFAAESVFVLPLISTWLGRMNCQGARPWVNTVMWVTHA